MKFHHQELVYSRRPPELQYYSELRRFDNGRKMYVNATMRTTRYLMGEKRTIPEKVRPPTTPGSRDFPPRRECTLASSDANDDGTAWARDTITSGRFRYLKQRKIQTINIEKTMFLEFVIGYDGAR